jgi:hypothetical protein
MLAVVPLPQEPPQAPHPHTHFQLEVKRTKKEREEEKKKKKMSTIFPNPEQCKADFIKNMFDSTFISQQIC